MKLANFLVLVLPAFAWGTPSLRHEETAFEKLLEKVHALELADQERQAQIETLQHAVEALQSQLVLQERRLTDSCVPELSSIDGSTCIFDKNVVFIEQVGFDNNTIFTGRTLLEGDVTVNSQNVLFTGQTSTKYDGEVVFAGPRYDADDDDSDFAVRFETEAMFDQEVLFEDECEFEQAVLFTGDVTMEGPDARRTRKKMRRDLGSRSSDDDDTTFEIVGKVDIVVESDNEFTVDTETYHEKDVHVGEESPNDRDSKSRRHRRRMKKDDDKVDGKLIVKEVDVVDHMLVEGLLEAGGDCTFHENLYYTSHDCLKDCTIVNHEYCP